MPHRRSMKARQRRLVKRFILKNSFKDRMKAESVCRTDPKAIIEMLQKNFDEVHLEVINYERGEVLVDSKGRGSLQRQERAKP